MAVQLILSPGVLATLRADERRWQLAQQPTNEQIVVLLERVLSELAHLRADLAELTGKK
jgi:hypothetical protein